ncbi:MAG: LysR family transcriptional regulator [Paracoccaceae bacterium]
MKDAPARRFRPVPRRGRRCRRACRRAETCGVSAPTLSRRLTALERRLGETLFRRGAQGGAAGRRAGGRCASRRSRPGTGASAPDLGAAGKAARARVRITAGHWTSHFLACHLDRVWSPDAPWVPELLASTA